MRLELLSLLVGVAVVSAKNDNGPCPKGSEHIVINFDEDDYGDPTKAGDVVHEQWLDYGIYVTGYRRVPHTNMFDESENAMKIFDSSNPTGGDWDLLSPNKQCDVCASNPDFPCPLAGHTNCNKQNQIMVIDSGYDEVWRAGGKIEVSFILPAVRVLSFSVMDVQAPEGGEAGDKSDSTYTIISTDGDKLRHGRIHSTGDNGWGRENIYYTSQKRVQKIKFNVKGPFALTHLNFCMMED